MSGASKSHSWSLSSCRRQVINGMIYKIRTGLPWRDLPDRYGPWQTVYTRFRRYALSGVCAQGPPADPGPG
ncbi:transposase [Streptomyces collinus]|uniref:transposase n=1 Tax=Streptomyces TaxID=1883 RepID=UPI003434819C